VQKSSFEGPASQFHKLFLARTSVINCGSADNRYVVAEQHFFKKLQTAEKTIMLQLCGYAMAEQYFFPDLQFSEVLSLKAKLRLRT
jgi:phosphatidylserine/phosphatidylglycerophosphate/cardiolipin synthase-like enzyme